DTWGAMLAYRHLWSDQWRSSVSASVVEADNPDTVAAGVAKAYRTAHVNMIYTPVARLELGGELIWGERENESGDKGDVERFQFSAKLAFRSRYKGRASGVIEQASDAENGRSGETSRFFWWGG